MFFEALGIFGAVVFVVCVLFYLHLETLRYRGVDVDHEFNKHIRVVNIVWLSSILLTLISISHLT